MMSVYKVWQCERVKAALWIFQHSTTVAPCKLLYILVHQCIKILNVCLCVCVMEVGSLGWWDYSSDSQPMYLCFVLCDNKQMHSRSSSWSECNWGAASWSRHNQGAAAEADPVRVQFGLTMRDYSAHQRHYCTRLFIRQSTRGCERLTQTWWRRWDHRSITLSAVKRELLCTMLC